MPVTSITKSPEDLTLTVVAEFPVPVRRLWDAYADPRQLERFWGPPGWPARFLRHDMAVGGRSHYAMSGPDGSWHPGYWQFTAVDAPRSFTVLDGFANEDFSPSTELPPVQMVYTFEETEAGSRVTTVATFASVEHLQTHLDMGMEQGLQAAMTQMDAVVTDLARFAADRLAEADIIDDTHVRVTRVIRGTPEQVWRAHNEVALLQRWMLGPDGWTMPVCDVPTEVGQPYRFEWEREGGGDRFGFTGELLALDPHYRMVQTEQMIGVDGPGTINEMTLTPVDGGTLLSVLITYPSKELRDMVLATGMVDGMEASYARLEAVALGD